MAKNSLAIIGTNRLAEELLDLSRKNGIEGTLHRDAGEAVESADCVIETGSGAEATKRSVLQRLDEALPAASVIVTSCARFSATEIGSWVSKPERIVGFATFVPLSDRKLVELAGGLKTADASLERTERLFKSLGKESVRVKDAVGLIFPRILSLIINEAARSLEEGVARAQEIDVAMRLGVNYPEGPLRWADRIGLDEVLAVLEGLERETGDDRYRPAPLLKKLVLAGCLGEAGGRGFYSYCEGQVKP